VQHPGAACLEIKKTLHLLHLKFKIKILLHLLRLKFKTI
jgi:hypothetical protein